MKITPPDESFKRQTVIDYIKRFDIDTFVETGSLWGDMIDAVQGICNEAYSIELSPYFYNHCVDKFKDCPNVHLFLGNSAIILPSLLTKIDKPALFWLDGHYSGGMTAKGPVDSPIQSEINALMEWGRDDAIILIDDVRCFNVEPDYPPINDIAFQILLRHPNWIFEQRDDIARAHRNKYNVHRTT